jgi:sugar lactone lactonase YvrE
MLALFVLLGSLTRTSYAASALGDPGLVTLNSSFGPELTVEHLYYDNFPTGIAVSRSGRQFSNFPRPGTFTLGELVNGTHEVAFPDERWNNPPSLVNDSNPMYGSDYKDYLISLQTVESMSVVLRSCDSNSHSRTSVDAEDRLWALDTGRPTVNGTMLLNSGGGKLVAFSLSSNSSAPLQTIVFPPIVAYPETFLNDIRFDLRPDLSSSSGKGVAYITDSSTQGRNGLIVVDLGSGRSWRHLDQHPSTLPEEGLVTAYDGVPFYPVMPTGPFAGAYTQLTVGSDGIALSADGAWLYYCPLAGRAWYRVPTALLRVPSAGPGSTPTAAMDARRAVQNLGRRPSHADGLGESDDGTIYLTAPEQEAIYAWKESDGLLKPLVRDPRIQWPDTMAVQGGKLWFTVNQYWLYVCVLFSVGYGKGG